MIENQGRIKRTGAVVRDGSQHISYRMKIDPEREFVVLRVYPNNNYIKEQLSEDDMKGEYPLTVDAKMLGPDGEYDEFGLEITFNMRSTTVEHLVNSVENTGFMHIIYKRIF
jgi:hypothetical protein